MVGCFRAEGAKKLKVCFFSWKFRGNFEPAAVILKIIYGNFENQEKRYALLQHLDSQIW